jgi:hypothetical protein
LLWTGGADTTDIGSLGKPALYYALVVVGDVGYVRLLLEYGADACFKDDGRSCFRDYGRSLLSSCADNQVDVSLMRPLVHVIGDRRLPRFINAAVNDEGETPLNKACRKGDLTRASFYLLECDADRKKRNHKGRSPLQTARRYGHSKCAELIRVSHRCDITFEGMRILDVDPPITDGLSPDLKASHTSGLTSAVP